MNLTKDHLIGAGVGAGAALILTGSIIGISKIVKKHKEKKIAEQVVALQKATATALANK
jgi:hypothetical protein|nr:MAG TPA: Mid2 like cell wall stress sensor [Caudoviricetes sp.]